jgi:hypothetical protein
MGWLPSNFFPLLYHSKKEVVKGEGQGFAQKENGFPFMGKPFWCYAFQ